MLIAVSPNDITHGIGKAQKAAMWAQFLEHGTSHSTLAATLSYIINRAEREKVPYTLQYTPNGGYFMKRTTKL